MKKFRWLLAIFFVFGVAAALSASHAPATTAIVPINLPIEVLGPRGTTASVTVNLPSVDGITEIYLRCHACGYDDRALDANGARTKASLRINGGPSIALKHYTGDAAVNGNPGIKVMEPENAYGGIGGGFRTVRFTVAAAGLKPGDNVFTFEHTDPDDRSVGFRIVELNVLRQGIHQLAANRFLMAHPAAWTPPLPGTADVDAGRLLWSRRDALYDPYVDMLDGQRNTGSLSGRLHAACADCHARDGRDLKYFRFSNEALIARSRFHRLTETQGKQIASYIRSLKTPAPPGAWPWNPPYQPGPGLDAKRATHWAAGAGIDAVLDHDADMRPYLFPNVADDADLRAVSAVVDRYRTLNMRELPIALQLPDWNNWLPRVHPLDAFDSAAAVVRTDETGQQVYDRPFYEVLYDEARAAPSNTALDNLLLKSLQWFGRGATCFTQTIDSGPDLRAVDSLVLKDGLSFPNAPVFTGEACADYRFDESRTWAVEAAKTGLSAWLSVKQWEIMQTNQMEETSQTIGRQVCSGSRCIDASEPRGWGSTQQNVFFRAAHFTGFDSRRFRDQDALVSTYGTTAWYQLQLILNSGYRMSQPSHFPYVSLWIEGLVNESGQPQSFRFWANMIKMRQLQTTGQYGVENGLDLRTAQPFLLFSEVSADSSLRSGVGPALWKSLTEAQLTDFLEDAANATADQWAAANQNRVVQPPTSTEIYPCDDACFNAQGAANRPFKVGAYQGQNTFRVVGKFRSDVHVAEPILNDLIDWGIEMWPLGDWESVRVGGARSARPPTGRQRKP
jgi:hypothetical protein